ncbi:hypothetical protein ABMA79_13560 [Halobacteriovorax sp. HFRX-2_2]|uniref:hypothetical protein n=1 Tax=unclassified Halobacteriovorax TaxID=2639665 RepID=UPI00371EC697
MNKLIAPLILILAFSMASCSKDAQKLLSTNTPSTTQLEPTDGHSDKVILNAKVGNFCEGHDCPDGIVAVKTNDKSVTCAGIVQSATEVLISQNCAEANNTFHVQTTAGEIIKVESVEETLSNEFDDKVLKLTTSKEIETQASISIPDAENQTVELLSFDKFGVLTKQSCELTYASLAYANSFDNESQLLNIKNCDGVKDGSLISQDGNVIGFLTKKHEEIALYEGVSLEGIYFKTNILNKIDKISLSLISEDAFIFGYLAASYPLNDADNVQETISFNEKTMEFKTTLKCYKNMNFEAEDKLFKLKLDNRILEFNNESVLIDKLIASYIPKSKVNIPLRSGIQQKYKDYNYLKYYGNINNLEKHYVKNPFTGDVINQTYKLPKNNSEFIKLDICK